MGMDLSAPAPTKKIILTGRTPTNDIERKDIYLSQKIFILKIFLAMENAALQLPSTP